VEHLSSCGSSGTHGPCGSAPSSGPYREASEPAPDEEVIALAQLVARAQRARRMVAVPILMAGVLLGAVAYLTLRVGLFEAIDVRAPYLVVLVTGLPMVVLAQAAAAVAGRWAVLGRAPRWIAEITKPGESPTLLEAFVRSL
jgi:hypothetical protein